MANLAQWDPFAELGNMHSRLDDIFNQYWSSGVSAPGAATADIYTEDDKQLIAEIQAPGFTKDDIEVQVHNGQLEIRGEKHAKEEQKATAKRTYMLRESHASFYRSIALPKTAEADKVKAHFENGILKVTVPLAALPAPKKVAISEPKKK